MVREYCDNPLKVTHTSGKIHGLQVLSADMLQNCRQFLLHFTWNTEHRICWSCRTRISKDVNEARQAVGLLDLVSTPPVVEEQVRNIVVSEVVLSGNLPRSK